MEISVIVPIYNDGNLADDFCFEFNEVFQNYYNSQNLETFLELIFVNDGSKNESMSELKKLTEKYSYVRIIDLSRNFGQHIALSCGYKHAKGNFVAMLNVDMQEPPSQIIKLLDHILINNIEIVYGLVAKRKTSFHNRISSSLFNILMNFLTQQKVPLNVSTLRIMSRKFINSYNEFSEKSRYLRGLEICSFRIHSNNNTHFIKDFIYKLSAWFYYNFFSNNISRWYPDHSYRRFGIIHR